MLVWSRLQCICTHGTSKGDRLAYYDYVPPHAIRQLMARGKQRRDQVVLTGQVGSRDLDLASVAHSCSPSRRPDEVHAPHHWGWGREREREGPEVGKSWRSRTTWTAVKGPQCWGRKGLGPNLGRLKLLGSFQYNSFEEG